jgi:hypothetical protein
MSINFFDNYKEFVVIPLEDKNDHGEEFHPHDYAKHFIITLSLNDSRITCWKEAENYQIEIDKSLEKVVREFNKKAKGSYYLQILELEEDKLYFVLALSCKAKHDNEKECAENISYLLEKMIANPLYVGECWYQLIGEKGRVERKLFTYAYKEYQLQHSLEASGKM